MTKLTQMLKALLVPLAAGLILILLVFVLWGRDASSAANASGVGSDPLVGIPSPATITGVVSYSGTVTGTHLVWVGAFTTTEGVPPEFAVMISGTGQYSLTVAPGTYYIQAGMDVDDSGGSPNPPIDLISAYEHNPLTVTAGALTTNINITLVDPVPPIPSITGLITFTSQISRMHQIVVFAAPIGGVGPPTNPAVIAGSGPYTLTDVLSGTYQVGAFMDLGDDMGPRQPNEPMGWYDADADGEPDDVIVTNGVVISNINIILIDPMTYIDLPLVRKVL